MKTIKAYSKLFIAAIIVVFLLLAVFIFGYWRWENKYNNRILPNSWVGDIELSGHTLEEAEQLIFQRIEKIEDSGLIFRHNDKTATLSLSAVSLEADLSTPTLTFSGSAAIQKAIQDSRPRTFFGYLVSRLSSQGRQKIIIPYELSSEKVRLFLQESFPDLNVPAENARFSWSEKSEPGTMEIIPERMGKEISYEQTLVELNKQLRDLAISPVQISTESTYPTVKGEDLAPLKDQAEKIIKQGGLTLRVAGLKTTEIQKYLTITPSQLVTWITAKKSETTSELSLDEEKIKKYLETTIAPLVDQEAIQPRFEIENNKVTSWQTGKSGLKLNLETSASKIAEEFMTGNSQIDLIIEEVPGGTVVGEETFRIEEIIGTGHSNFKGSSANRRKNIRVGAAALHGLLIKPGEEFSLINTLGEVSDKTGYVTELVIKGDKTIPEYGGGLCQIGTTVFRTALASGLPITMRQNHSYRVSYYEPAGTDATIYIPQPDFRFINDSGNYILIQARIDGDDLYFDFWGVKDGRQITITDPVIYNIVKPAPTKIVLTDSLKPGEKKCTESSHNGADTYFDYKVVYPEGSTSTPVQERRFSSHYVPWQAVCLIGATSTVATSTATLTSTASTTATSSPAAASSTPPQI
jgi:vancomycin resistance protein YoaR